MNLLLQSGPTEGDATQGSIYVDGAWECHTLEDAVREPKWPAPVFEWKVHGRTAIPAGRYFVTLEDSPRFGPDTITLNDVPGFAFIRIHGGNKAADTDGCILVGDTLDWDHGTISGAARDGVLAKLKAKIKAALDPKVILGAGQAVWIDVRRT